MLQSQAHRYRCMCSVTLLQHNLAMRIQELLESKNKSVITINNLYHVGSLDQSKKRSGSLEGSGLSVSTKPDAWRRIARGHVAGDTYRAIKPGNKFLNARSITKKIRSDITTWALNNNLIEQATIYRVSHYDDELESTVYSDFETLKQAEREAYDKEDIQEIPGGIKATNKLRSISNNPNISATGILDYVLPLYAQDQGYDGVWWNDILDVNKWSAPRGVIVPSMISTWKFEKI